MKRPSSSTVKLGLLQTSCSADPAANLKKTLACAERAAKQGAQIICTQELFRSQYISARARTTKYFKLAERQFPARRHGGVSKARQKSIPLLSSPRFLKSAPPAFITIPPPSLTPTARSSACIARCTFPTIRCSTRNFISRPAILVFARGTLAMARLAC